MCQTYVSDLCVRPMCQTYVSDLCVRPLCQTYVSDLCVRPLCQTSMSDLYVRPLCHCVSNLQIDKVGIPRLNIGEGEDVCQGIEGVMTIK
jgi:hypothetical protein